MREGNELYTLSAGLESKFGTGWVLKMVEPTGREIRKHRFYEKVNKIAKHLFYCDECGFAWEKMMDRKDKLEKYDDFPIYGLTHKVCKDCK